MIFSRGLLGSFTVLLPAIRYLEFLQRPDHRTAMLVYTVFDHRRELVVEHFVEQTLVGSHGCRVFILLHRPADLGVTHVCVFTQKMHKPLTRLSDRDTASFAYV